MKCKEIQEQGNVNLQLKNKKKVQKLKEKGITLIALVVTIIILLILAGVTLNMALSGDGLFSKAKLAVEKNVEESERETLNLSIINYNMSNDKKDKLGEELKSNSTENPDWTVIKLKNENKQYGTNYNYIKEGTEIEGYGKTKYNWVINYENGEIIQLGDHLKVSSGEGVAVTDNLELNINPKSMKESGELGLGIKFVSGEGDDLGSKLNDNYIEFDGINDYLKLENVHVEANGGFSFEIFGEKTGSAESTYLLNKTVHKGDEITLNASHFRSKFFSEGFSCCLGTGKARR